MFDIGFWEIGLIAILALVVLGPKRLPEAARAAGYWIGRARQFIANAKSDLDQEIQGGGLEELRRLKEELEETRRFIQQAAGKTETDITDAIDEIESTSENSIGGRSRTSHALNKKRKTKSSKNRTSAKKATGKKATGKKTSAKKKSSTGSSVSRKAAKKKSVKNKASTNVRKKSASKKPSGK